MTETNAIPAIDQLLAKQEITELIHRYARAIDRMDDAMLRGVFHAGATHRHFYEGPSSDPTAPYSEEEPGDFVAFAMGVLRAHERTHHQIGNVLIELRDVDTAVGESYFTAHHRMRPIGDPLAGPTACDTPMDYFVGGRYLDRYALKDGRWAITERTGMTDWVRLDAPSSAIMHAIDAETLGRQNADDLVYRL
ncbi:MAG: nuclear transport factor 2 family protein [Congregibacter sp.]